MNAKGSLGAGVTEGRKPAPVKWKGGGRARNGERKKNSVARGPQRREGERGTRGRERKKGSPDGWGRAASDREGEAERRIGATTCGPQMAVREGERGAGGLRGKRKWAQRLAAAQRRIKIPFLFIKSDKIKINPNNLN